MSEGPSPSGRPPRPPPTLPTPPPAPSCAPLATGATKTRLFIRAKATAPVRRPRRTRRRWRPQRVVRGWAAAGRRFPAKIRIPAKICRRTRGRSGGRRGSAGPGAPLAARHLAVIAGKGRPTGMRCQLRKTAWHARDVIWGSHLRPGGRKFATDANCGHTAHSLTLK